jgi:hypothetical protein
MVQQCHPLQEFDQLISIHSDIRCDTSRNSHQRMHFIFMSFFVLQGPRNVRILTILGVEDLGQYVMLSVATEFVVMPKRPALKRLLNLLHCQ